MKLNYEEKVQIHNDQNKLNMYVSLEIPTPNIVESCFKLIPCFLVHGFELSLHNSIS